MKNLGIMIIAGLLVLCSSCRQNVQQSMHFQVNPALLGTTEHDSVLQVAYAAPATFVRSAHELSLKQSWQEGVEIVTVYQQVQAQAFMIISSMDKAYWKALREQLGETDIQIASQVWNTVSTATFEHHGFDVQQWLLQNQEWINFKLIFETRQGQYFQVDYLVPHAAYDEQLAHAIESSIGSFQSI